MKTLYELDNITYLNYAQGRDIRLPRFQRKDVWSDQKNFALLISVFLGYPIGVVVLNEEKALHKRKGLITTSWLLDGRQRRTSLMCAYNNPEVIYAWAKKFIKFSNNAQPEEIRDAFWHKIESYLERDEDEFEIVEDKSFEENNNDLLDVEEDLLEEIDEEDDDDLINEDDSYVNVVPIGQHIGLKMLLEIILMCHKKTKNGTSYTKPFKYASYFRNVPFIESNNEVNPEKLTKFLREFIDSCTERDFQMNDYISFCESQFSILDDKKEAFSRNVSYHWPKVSKTINSIWDLVLRFEQGKMPVIRLNNVKSSDAQNIFKLINSSGTPLTAVEMLSAKPSWNRNVKTVSKDLEKAVNALYSVLNIKAQGVVRWDVAATIIDRLNELDYIFKPLSYGSTTEFKTKITLGFKLLAGIYEEGINREDLSNLSKHKEINWENIDLLIDDINEMGKVLLKSPFFKTLRSWNNSLMGITSDAIALNFTILMYREWCDSKGKPRYSDKLFIKKAIALFDKSIYEYITRKWRGSGDSKIAGNIDKFHTDTTFDTVDEDSWILLIQNLIIDDKIDGIKANTGETKAVLYYYYMLSTICGPGFGVKSDVDHIIPQDQFKNGMGVDGKLNKDNLANLCLLESETNNAKRKKNLNYLISTVDSNNDNKIIVQKICSSLSLSMNDLKDIALPSDLPKLKSKRQPLIEKAFSELRAKYLQG